MGPISRIFCSWTPQFFWLAAGVILSLAALEAGVALMAVSGYAVGAAVAGVVTLPLVLRVFGASRVVLRYLERVMTHTATFRALADVRVWFFKALGADRRGRAGVPPGRRRAVAAGRRCRGAGRDLSAHRAAAGGGDAAAAGDGAADRDTAPRCWRPRSACCSLSRRSCCRGWRRAPRRAPGPGWRREAGALRVAALDALTGLREVRAFAAEGRMLAAVQAKESRLFAAQQAMSGRTALASAAAFLCAQVAVLAVLIDAGAHPAAAVAAAFLVLAAFEAIGGLPRAGAMAGHASAAARRVLEAADAPVPVPDPADPAAMPLGTACGSRPCSSAGRPIGRRCSTG